MNHLVVEVFGGGPFPVGIYLTAVNEDLVNLRFGPGLNFAVISVLPKNKELKVQRSFNGWIQVETIPREGYIRKDFAKKTNPGGGTSDQQNVITYATVKTDRLGLRSGADEKYTALAYLNTGTQIKVKDVATNWLRVQPAIASTYATGQYIREINSKVPVEPPGAQDPLKSPTHEIVPNSPHFN